MIKKLILFVAVLIVTVGSVCYAEGPRKPDPAGFQISLQLNRGNLIPLKF
jgi:hypothetical protein